MPEQPDLCELITEALTAWAERHGFHRCPTVVANARSRADAVLAVPELAALCEQLAAAEAENARLRAELETVCTIRSQPAPLPPDLAALANWDGATEDDALTRWRRTWTTYRRDAGCSCMDPDGSTCGCANGRSEAWQCACHTVNGIRPAAPLPTP